LEYVEVVVETGTQEAHATGLALDRVVDFVENARDGEGTGLLYGIVAREAEVAPEEATPRDLHEHHTPEVPGVKHSLEVRGRQSVEVTDPSELSGASPAAPGVRQGKTAWVQSLAFEPSGPKDGFERIHEGRLDLTSGEGETRMLNWSALKGGVDVVRVRAPTGQQDGKVRTLVREPGDRFEGTRQVVPESRQDNRSKRVSFWGRTAGNDRIDRTRLMHDVGWTFEAVPEDGADAVVCEAVLVFAGESARQLPHQDRVVGHGGQESWQTGGRGAMGCVRSFEAWAEGPAGRCDQPKDDVGSCFGYSHLPCACSGCSSSCL
jgi:hypothetical protein